MTRIFEDMRTFFESLKNMVYPVENSRYTTIDNEYYSQREWKLPASLIYRDSDGKETQLAKEASLEQQQELLDINYDFFSKKINFYGMILTRAQLSLFLKNIDNKAVLEHANKIIVPIECFDAVKGILIQNNLAVPVEVFQ